MPRVYRAVGLKVLESFKLDLKKTKVEGANTSKKNHHKIPLDPPFPKGEPPISSL